MAEISPMMRQYMDIKNNYKDSILFFRLGDFYEMFFEDAKLVSEELDLTLTGKDYGQTERAPMCGIPYHSCEAYIARLVAKGYKIAMCDQVENPAQAKGIVKREVVRVITPGTVMEDSMLDESKNNYMASVYCSAELNEVGVAFCDVSTGELKVTSFGGKAEEVISELRNELGKFLPKEMLISGKITFLNSLKSFIKEKLSCLCEIADKELTLAQSEDIIKNHFNEDDLNKLKIDQKFSVIQALGCLFYYLQNTHKLNLDRINNIENYNKSEYMGLDLNTVRNLELVETMRSKSKKGSLLWVLDKTKTAMGKRMLRAWIERPLLNFQKIILRQDAVEELVNNTILRSEFYESLSGVHDMERLMTKITHGSAGARDLKSLAAAISKLPAIKSNLLKTNSSLLKQMCSDLNLLSEVFELINSSITDEPPFSVREGGIIKAGYSQEVDSLRKDIGGGKNIVAEIEQREREKTGIPKLKIGYNKVFGYYIEVSNSFKDKVPVDYIRKQTLSNCERFITSELKELESRILYAKDKINEIEFQIFDKVRREVATYLPEIIKTANVVAKLDVICSFAQIAAFNSYCKPQMVSEKIISIKEGRHPVVEALSSDCLFVPNNTLLDNENNMINIITGPNMAGKSTFMRQTALIVLMAQIGSFVPAESATIGIVDNIFTRIGASDDLASGQSTFMVEMNEVSDILKNATSDSLLILDEIGRGTSTFDGMSIAKAVLEYIAGPKGIRAKTLFATHYHELTVMENEFENIKNYNIAVKKNGDDITFLRRIVRGAADESYGIEVAKLAGLPTKLTNRAKEILKSIESPEHLKSEKAKNDDVAASSNEQIGFSDAYMNYGTIIDKVKNIDISVITPIESMNILYELVKLANNI